MSRVIVSGLFAAAVLGMSGADTKAAPATHWIIRDLGTLAWKESEAAGINDRGQVVGLAFTPPASSVAPVNRGHAFLWEQGRIRDLGTLGGDCSTSAAYAINNAGQVAGASGSYADCSFHDYSERPMLWQSGKARPLAGPIGAATEINNHGDVLIPGGGQSMANAGAVWVRGRLVTLVLPRGWTFGDAADINDYGSVVGDAGINARNAEHALLWKDGHPRELGSDPGWPVSQATAISNTGAVVGNSYRTLGAWLDSFDPLSRVQSRAIIWRSGRLADLETLGGRSSHANAINATDEVVGWCTRPTNNRHAVLWQGGRVHDLGTLRGRRDSEAIAINEHGVVTGNSFILKGDAQYAEHAFVWRQGQMIDLGTLPGGKTSGAVAINAQNEIVGWSTTNTRRKHAVLWSPK